MSKSILRRVVLETKYMRFTRLCNYHFSFELEPKIEKTEKTAVPFGNPTFKICNFSKNFLHFLKSTWLTTSKK